LGAAFSWEERATYLKRKSDGLILCSHDNIRQFGWWHYRNHHYAEIATVTGVRYMDSRGVAQKYIRVKLWFADHYANSTLANLDRLENAQRRRQALQFQDSAGGVYDVAVHEKIGDQLGSWDEVVTKSIVVLECHLRRLAYVQ
jgi:hypothetical protein